MAAPRPTGDGLTLEPAGGALYVVRWVRQDGSLVKHRYYRRPQQAAAFAARLREGGWTVRLYATVVAWEDATSSISSWRHRNRNTRAAAR